VLGLNSGEIRDLYALRAAMEGLAVEIATERLNEADFSRLSLVNQTLRDNRHAWSPDALSALNREFHFGIYMASSPIISSQISKTWGSTPPFARIWGSSVESDRLVEEHELILQAMIAGDKKRARRLMEDHITGSALYRERLRQDVSDEIDTDGSDSRATR
jgi:DNA-binding GntR family transcriptional regulator